MWWEYVGMRQTGLCRWQRYVIMVPLSNVLLNCNEGFCFFMFLLILILSLVWCKCSWFVTLVWLLVQMCIISPTIGCWQISRSACPLFQRKLVSAHGISQWSHYHSDHTLAHGFDWKSDIAQKSVKIHQNPSKSRKWRVICLWEKIWGQVAIRFRAAIFQQTRLSPVSRACAFLRSLYRLRCKTRRRELRQWTEADPMPPKVTETIVLEGGFHEFHIYLGPYHRGVEY